MAQVNVLCQSQSVQRSFGLTEQLEQQATNQSKSVTEALVSDLTYNLKLHATRDKLFEEKASWLISILFGDQYLCTKCLHVSPLIQYHLLVLYLWAGWRVWVANCTFVFSSRTFSVFPRSTIYKIPSWEHRHHCKCSNGLTSLWYVHTVFIWQGYLWVQISALNGWQAIHNVCFELFLRSLSLNETFVFTWCHSEGKHQLILALPLCNISWSEWNQPHLWTCLDQRGTSDL